MSREFMPKSSALMPYVVVNRDAAVSGVSTIDGVAGAIDLTTKYVQITDYNQRVGSVEARVTTNEGDISNIKTSISSINGSITSINSTLSNKASKGVNSDITSLTALSGPLRLGGDAVSDYDAVTLKQLQASSGGSGGASITGVMNNFLGAVEWFNGSRAKLPSGHLAADGQLLNRSDYPDLWAAINSGILLSVDDTTWLNASGTTYTNRGKYSTGNGSTTFRMPDLNGIQSGSLDGLFLSASAKANSSTNTPARDVGIVYNQSAPNIFGTVANFNNIQLNGSGSAYPILSGASGAFKIYDSYSDTAYGITAGGSFNSGRIDFYASNSDSTYGNAGKWLIPRSVGGIWVIRVNGSYSAANTNFNVINGDTTTPANGTIVYGGDVKSVYQIGGVDTATASFRAKYSVGGVKTAEVRVIDGSTITSWTMPATAGTLFGSGDLTATAWINLSLQSNWAVNTNSRAVYRKVLGIVFIDLHANGGSYSDGSLLTTLPSGYRPPVDVQTVPFAVGAGGSIPPRLIIGKDGSIRIYNMGGNGDLHLTTSFCVE